MNIHANLCTFSRNALCAAFSLCAAQLVHAQQGQNSLHQAPQLKEIMVHFEGALVTGHDLDNGQRQRAALQRGLVVKDYSHKYLDDLKNDIAKQNYAGCKIEGRLGRSMLVETMKMNGEQQGGMMAFGNELSRFRAEVMRWELIRRGAKMDGVSVHAGGPWVPANPAEPEQIFARLICAPPIS